MTKGVEITESPKMYFKDVVEDNDGELKIQIEDPHTGDISLATEFDLAQLEESSRIALCEMDSSQTGKTAEWAHERNNNYTASRGLYNLQNAKKEQGIQIDTPRRSPIN